jgi:hypothetical protein
VVRGITDPATIEALACREALALGGGNSTSHHMLVLVLHRTTTCVCFCREHHILL